MQPLPHVLIVRSGTHYALLQCLDALRLDHSSRSFGVLCHAEWSESVRPLAAVHLYPSPDAFSADLLTPALIADLSSGNYDAAIALYNTAFGLGYENVDALLEKIPVPVRLGYDAERDEWIVPTDPSITSRRAEIASARAANQSTVTMAVKRVRKLLES